MDRDCCSRRLLDELCMRMIGFFAGDPKRIQHFLKVHSFARLIGTEEGLEERTLFLLEAAAYTHDIGIRPAEEKYGSCGGKLQEQEGPACAQRMLLEVGFPEDMIERICYLIGHHHTYTNVDGTDYRILIEADFLVNLYEDHAGGQAVRAAYERIFRTRTGKRILREMYGIAEEA